MAIDLNKLIVGAQRQAHARETAHAVNEAESLRKGTHRVRGASELKAIEDRSKHGAGYHYVFCTHNRPYWETCSKCGRDKDLARRNADMVLKAVGGAAFFTK